LNISPQSIKDKITDKTKAIVCVHWGGYPCDMDEINSIAREFNLKVIEDAAHALGAEYKGKPVGAISDFTCFSFQAIKQITSIDGGMLTLKEHEDYKRGKLLRWYGIDREWKGDVFWKYQINEPGFKFHMNDVTASILKVQLDQFDLIMEKRNWIVERYNRELQNVQGLKLLRRDEDRKSGNWLFTLLVDRRDDFQKKLIENGIESSIVHFRNDYSPIFGGKRLELPTMNEIEKNYICIPVHNHMTYDDVTRVIETIKSGW